MSTRPRIQKFPCNTLGRDFVVGDIHGAFELIYEAMRQVRFDAAVDRLFSVGDLIDRGPDSGHCVEFLAHPFVHAVRGNHEDMLLEVYANGTPPPHLVWEACRHNGSHWWLGLTEQERGEVLCALRELPLAIEVDTPRGTVGLIHADVPRGMSWQDFLAHLEAGDPYVTDTCLWGRSRIHQKDDQGVPGVGRIFVGHTPQWSGLSRYGNLIAIDTGAVYGHMGADDDGHLTLAAMLAQTSHLTAPRQSRSLIELKNDPPEVPAPFEAYAQNGYPEVLVGLRF